MLRKPVNREGFGLQAPGVGPVEARSPKSGVRSRIASVARVVALVVVAAGAGACRQDMHDAPRYEPLESNVSDERRRSGRHGGIGGVTLARGLGGRVCAGAQGIAGGPHDGAAIRVAVFRS